MNNVIRPDAAWWQSKRPPPPSGPTEPPPMDISDRVTKIETVLPTLATKEDLVREVGGLRTEMHKEIGGLHKEMTSQTWRIITWVTGLFMTLGSGMVAATYFIAKHAG